MKKTIRLYKFYPLSIAKLNLGSKKLKISRINELNDPFETEPFHLADQYERRYWKECKEKISSMAGFISFCEGWRNPLMWAHYADHHKGLCLGFDITSDLANQVSYVLERKKLQSVRAFIERMDGPAMRYVLTTKFRHWEYEQEHRVFSPLDLSKPTGELQFEPFSKDIVLRSVVIGVRANTSQSEIRALVGPRVKIITARMAFRTFDICPQHETKLQK